MSEEKLRNKSLIENIKRFDSMLHAAQGVLGYAIERKHTEGVKTNSFSNIFNILLKNWASIKAEFKQYPSSLFNIVYVEYYPISANDLYKLSSERYARFKKRYGTKTKLYTFINELDVPLTPSFINTMESAMVLKRAGAFNIGNDIAFPNATELFSIAGNISGIIATFSASSTKAVTYSLTGACAELFTVSAGGIISLEDPLGFEDPSDAPEINVYAFTLQGDFEGDTVSTDIIITATSVGEYAVSKGKKTILYNGQLYSKKQIKIINRGRDPEYKTYTNIDNLPATFSASEMKVISKYRLLEIKHGTQKLDVRCNNTCKSVEEKIYALEEVLHNYIEPKYPRRYGVSG